MASVSLFHTEHTDAAFRPIFEAWDETCSQHPDRFPDVFGESERAQELREGHPRVEEAMWAHVRSMTDLDHDGEDVEYQDQDGLNQTYRRRLRPDESDGIVMDVELNTLQVHSVNLREGSTDVVSMAWSPVDVRVARTQDSVRFSITGARLWAVTEAKKRVGLRIEGPFGLQRSRGHLRRFHINSAEIREIRATDTTGPDRARREKFRRGDGSNDVGITGNAVHVSQVHDRVLADRLHIAGWHSTWWDAKAEVNGLTGTVSVPLGSTARLDAYVTDVVLPTVRRVRGNLLPIANPF